MSFLNKLKFVVCWQKRVEEDVGVIQLVVERAQGINGEVSVEWKTADGTASSAGMTTFDFVVSVAYFLPLAV